MEFMKKTVAFIYVITSILFCSNVLGQIVVTGKSNTVPNLASTYSTLNAAINALNNITAINGPVEITVSINSYSETAPAGGFQIIMANITNTISSPVIINGDHKATITAYSPQISGSLNDAVFKIIGADFITIEKFTIQENISNTISEIAANTKTEWGIALLRRATGQNGAQNNSIIDNDIALDRIYPNSFGIYSNVRHLPTTPTATNDITNISGSNCNNHIYYNRISNVNMGVAIIGCNVDNRMDELNDIGGNSAETGNSISNWGGTSLPTASFAGNDNTQYC